MSNRLAIDIGGQTAGWVFSVEGAHAAPGSIAGPKEQSITLTFGTGMSKVFYDWIKDFFDHRQTPRDGAIIMASSDHQEMSRMAFIGALITEVGMPALDAASREAARTTVRLAVESLHQASPPSGSHLSAPTAHKAWQISNYRLTIDGLDTSRVNKIEALAVPHTGRASLVITLAEADAIAFQKWHEDSVTAGEGQEKGGTLEYLAPGGGEVLFSLTFGRLGISRVTPDKVESGNELGRRVKAEMYCENIKFDYKESWA